MINTNYKYIGDKSFYIGDWESSVRHNDIKDEIIQSTIGLPTAEEMFSANDIDLGETNTINDHNVFENI